MACFGEFWVVLAVHLKFRVSNGILNYRQIRLRLYAVFMTDRQLPVYVRFAVKSSLVRLRAPKTCLDVL